MEIDFDALLSSFRDAKEEKTFPKKAVSDYVMSRGSVRKSGLYAF